MRNLDAEDDRNLAVVDHLARLGRCLDDAEPALAGAAFLRVDVVLHVAHELDLADSAFHLVASRRIRQTAAIDRKSGGGGKSGSVRVDLGGRRRGKKKKN